MDSKAIVFWVLCILQLLLIFVQSNKLNIAFLVDSIQKEIANDVSAGLQEIDKMNFDTKVKDFVLVVSRDGRQSSDLNKVCSIISSEGISIVVDLTYERWDAGLQLIESSRIPYLRVGLVLSPFLIILSEFLQEKGANDVALIFQNHQDEEEALYHIIRGFPLRVIIINAGDNADFTKRLKKLRPSPSYVAVFAGGTNMNLIFEKIHKSKLFARPEEWHFVFLDATDGAFKYNQEAEYATKFTINPKTICKALHIRDLYCGVGFTRAIILEILKSLTDIKHSNSSLLQPLITNCSNLSSSSNSTDMLSGFDITAKLKNTDFLKYANDVDSSSVLTYSVNMSINLFSNKRDSVTDLAIWQMGKMKKINQTISPARRFFRIGTAVAIPWSFYRRDPRTGKISTDRNGNRIWEGYCIDLIAALAERMDFAYEIVAPSQGLFGKRDRISGTWDGVVGDLVTGETDFAVAALKMTSEREEVIDFIAPYFEQTGISIVIRKPVRDKSLFKFMTVLRVEVWLSIVAALVATAIMIWLLDKYSPYSARNNKKAYPYPCRDFTIKESFWFALTSFTPQGGGEAPKAISGRILVAAYWLFVVLMLATFTANLAAFLTVERMQTPVQSLEQLSRQSRINYTVVDGSDTHKYFINMKFAEDTLYRLWKELALNATTDQDRYRIWDYPIKEQYGHILLAINASLPVRDAAEGFRKVNEHENADFAFIHDSAEIKYEITRNCNFTEVGEVFAEQPYAIAVQQGSHLSDEISYKILEMQKDRFFEDLMAKYWNHSLIKECSRSEDQGGITLESLGGVFIATLFGLALAMVTLTAEVLYYKNRNKFGGSITKVIPVKEAPVCKANFSNGTTDENEKGMTPPPTFEAATFRGKKIPQSITLGGNEFQPRRMRKGTLMPPPKNENVSYLSRNQGKKDSLELPVYYE